MAIGGSYVMYVTIASGRGQKEGVRIGHAAAALTPYPQPGHRASIARASAFDVVRRRADVSTDLPLRVVIDRQDTSGQTSGR